MNIHSVGEMKSEHSGQNVEEKERGRLMKVISSHIGAPLDRNLGSEVGEAVASMMNMIIGV